MKKILITGGNGYIAKELYLSLKDEYDVEIIYRNIFDLSDSFKTKEWFNGKYFDVIIHCAAEGVSRELANKTSVLDNNLKMYYNLLENKNHYDRFINIGSGAESFYNNEMYGLSKYVIKTSILDKENFYEVMGDV